MKINHTLIFFFLFVISSPVLAEYNGHHLEFKIELIDGEEIHGYQYLAEIFPKEKGIMYKEFLEKNYLMVLRTQSNIEVGERSYFQTRLKYNYIDLNNEARFIFALNDQVGIDEKNIKSLTIIEMIDFTYTMGVNICNWEDEIWMHEKPVQRYSTGGRFCSHDIFIHVKNKETDKIILELDKVYQTFEKELKAKQSELYGDNHDDISNSIDELEEGLDDKIADVVVKFDGQKVVIVTQCTC